MDVKQPVLVKVISEVYFWMSEEDAREMVEHPENDNYIRDNFRCGARAEIINNVYGNGFLGDEAGYFKGAVVVPYGEYEEIESIEVRKSLSRSKVQKIS